MVVCKFFQHGFCRFGKNCRYEHIYGSKYSYHANQPAAAAPAPAPAPQQPSGVTDEQLVNQVQSDIQAVLRGGQWIHSCYSPFKDKPYSFPGLADLSPEEARLFMYEAKKNNTLGVAVNYMNELEKTTKQKYAQLLQPNVAIIQVLRRLYQGECASSPFVNQESNAGQNAFSSNNTASSVFRSAVQTAPMNTQPPNNAQSIFSQAQKSIFNTQPTEQMDAAKDLFSKASNTNVFGPSVPSANIFQTQQNQDMAAKSIFASAVQNNFNTNNQSNAASIFAAANQNTSPFSQGNVFQASPSPGSVFVQPNKPQVESDSGVYSMMDELTEDDLEAYKSDSFQLGFIPDLPPPYELCMAPTNTSFLR